MWNSASAPLRAGSRLGEHLLQRVAVRAVFLRQPRVRAEHARLPQDADVRRIDVLVRRERDDGRRASRGSPRRPARRGRAGPAMRKSVDAVGRRQPLARRDLVGDRREAPGREMRRAVERDGSGHGAHSSKRLTASVTLWPPKPKLLLSAASHLALHRPVRRVVEVALRIGRLRS